MPESYVAVVTFSGRASVASFAERRRELSDSIAGAGVTATGPALRAQFDAPRTPGLLRRNEVQQPVLAPDSAW